jgi:hypothetical protein
LDEVLKEITKQPSKANYAMRELSANNGYRTLRSALAEPDRRVDTDNTLQAFAAAMERSDKNTKSPRAYRNLVAHNRPTAEQMQSLLAAFSGANLWADEQNTLPTKHGQAQPLFLGQPLVTTLLAGLNVPDAHARYENLLTWLRRTLRDHDVAADARD